MIPSFSCPHATECRGAWTLRLRLACLGDGSSPWLRKNSYRCAAKKHVKKRWTYDKRWRLLNTTSVGSCRLASRHPSIFFYPLLLACSSGKTRQPKPPPSPSTSSSSRGSLMALYDMYPPDPPKKDLPWAESELMMYSDPAAQHALRDGRFGTKQLHLDEERAPQQVGCKGLTPPQAPAAVRLCSAWRGTMEPGGGGQARECSSGESRILAAQRSPVQRRQFFQIMLAFSKTEKSLPASRLCLLTFCWCFSVRW